MGFDTYRMKKKEIEVDLIPVMNLFVVLIPFLLLCAAFYHVSVIPTSLPSQTTGSSDLAADTTSVTVTLQLKPGEVHISCANAVLEPEVLDALAMTIQRTNDGSDLALLQRALYEIKKLYPSSDTVIVLGGKGVVYRELVEVLDSARELVQNKDESNEVRLPLFPVVVLSKKVQ